MAQIDLMEVAEATAVESAILWQVQTILEALLPTGELDAWLHGVGLAGAIGELKSEVERMETVINGVKGRAVGNKPLAQGGPAPSLVSRSSCMTPTTWTRGG